MFKAVGRVFKGAAKVVKKVVTSPVAPIAIAAVAPFAFPALTGASVATSGAIASGTAAGAAGLGGIAGPSLFGALGTAVPAATAATSAVTGLTAFDIAKTAANAVFQIKGARDQRRVQKQALEAVNSQVVAARKALEARNRASGSPAVVQGNQGLSDQMTATAIQPPALETPASRFHAFIHPSGSGLALVVSAALLLYAFGGSHA